MGIEEEIRRGRVHGKLSEENLEGLPVLGRLPHDKLELLAEDCRWHRHNRHFEIAGPDDDGERVSILHGGIARRYMLVQERELTCAIHRRGAVIDLAGLPAPEAAVTHVEAIVDETVVITLPRQTFRDAVLQPAAAELLEAVSTQADEVNHLLLELFGFEGDARLAHKLAELALEAPDRIVRYTHSELGAMVGLARQQVGGHLTLFLDRGLDHYLPHHQREIEVREVERLAQWGEPLRDE